jgi:hypothetical protein
MFILYSALILEPFKGRYNNIWSNDFILEVIRGNVPGHGFMRKFFRNSNTALNDFEDVWDYASVEPEYTYTTDPGAEYYVFSSSAVDIGQVLYIHLLDSEYKTRFRIVTLQGQTPIKIRGLEGEDELFTRVYRAFNVTNTPFTGNVFITEGDGVTLGAPDDTADVRAFISIGNEQTQMCHYTIPNRMYGALLGFDGSVVNKQTAAVDANAFARGFGGTFRIQEYIGLNTAGNSYVSKTYATPILLPPKTDLKVRSSASVAGAGVTGGYEILLFEEEFALQAANRIIV